MSDEAAEQDIRERIENALAILAAQGHEPHALQRNLALAVETLRAAKGAIEERDSQLDLVTAPERDAAKEAERLRSELEAAELRVAQVEQQLALARQDQEIEVQLHDEDRRRLTTLERKAKELDTVLMEDDAAFARFMERKLDEQDEQTGRKRRRP